MSNGRITLFLIDDDPIFRLGLTTALATRDNLEILAEGDTQQVREKLTEQIPDVILLDPYPRGWQLSQQLKGEYPQVKICLLTQSLSVSELLAAKESGLEAYCPKGKTLEQLVTLLHHIASGATYWQDLSTLIDSNSPNLSQRKKWLSRLFSSGIAQIEQSLSLVNNQLEKPQLTNLDWLFWTGRRRELLASRWIVRSLMPQEVIEFCQPPSPKAANNPLNEETSPVLYGSNFSLVSSSNTLTVSNLLDEILTRIQLGLENATNVPLEIDILPPEKRRELLYLVYSQVRNLITEFPLLDIPPEHLQERLSLILLRIWENSTRLFIEIYYPNKQKLVDGLLEEIIDRESRSVEQDILTKIPLKYDLFAYLLYQKNLLIEKVEYRPESPEAQARAGILLENLLVQIANGVIAVILNNFFDHEAIQKLLYKRGMRSSREIARFRNQLSWKYRKEKYWQEPKDIFESQYRLWFFKGGKN